MAAGQSRVMQRENCPGDQYHHLVHLNLRHLGRGWDGLWRSVLRRGLGYWGVVGHSWGSVGGGLGLPEKQGDIVGECQRRKGGTTFTSFSVHLLALGVECLLYEQLSGCQLPQPSQSPNVGTTNGPIHFRGCHCGMPFSGALYVSLGFTRMVWNMQINQFSNTPH